MSMVLNELFPKADFLPLFVSQSVPFWNRYEQFAFLVIAHDLSIKTYRPIDVKLKSSSPVQKKKYSRVRTMDDDGEDDEKDQIADEIFTRDGDGDGEDGGEGGEALHPGDDEEEEDGEESGRVSAEYPKNLYAVY